MFSQPVVERAHKLSSFIAVETPNSAHKQLHVHHRFSDCLVTLVCQRFDKSKARLPSQSNHQILRPVVDHRQSSSEVRTNFYPCSRGLPLSSCRRCCRPLIVMDVHDVYPGKSPMSTLSMRQQPPTTEPGVSTAEQIVPRRRRGDPVHQSVRVSHFLSVLSTLHKPLYVSQWKCPSFSPLAVMKRLTVNRGLNTQP